MNKKTLAISATLVVFVIAVGAFAVTSMADFYKVMFISGTEYQTGETGQVIVRTLNTFGTPLTSDWCNVTIVYPNKTAWVTNQAMTQGGATIGSWYYTFTTPFNIVGNYEEYVVCQIPTPQGSVQRATGSSFHVSQTLSTLNDTMTAQVVIIS